jgi:hypothetical protein
MATTKRDRLAEYNSQRLKHWSRELTMLTRRVDDLDLTDGEKTFYLAVHVQEIIGSLQYA